MVAVATKHANAEQDDRHEDATGDDDEAHGAEPHEADATDERLPSR